MHSDKHCCLCGAQRRVTQAPVPSFGNEQRIVRMTEHRPMQNGCWECSPELIVNVSMWRNGGTDQHTHMCDDCIVVGLTEAKRFVDAALCSLGSSDRVSRSEGGQG